MFNTNWEDLSEEEQKKWNELADGLSDEQSLKAQITLNLLERKKCLFCGKEFEKSILISENDKVRINGQMMAHCATTHSMGGNNYQLTKEIWKRILR